MGLGPVLSCKILEACRNAQNDFSPHVYRGSVIPVALLSSYTQITVSGCLQRRAQAQPCVAANSEPASRLEPLHPALAVLQAW